jgi:uncharacterized protein (DUF58 family)
MTHSAPAQDEQQALQYLHPDVLSRLQNLELVARFIVEGLVIGLHRSPYHGFSVEFSSYRKYSPGDDLKFLDWRVFARTDRFYIKQFEETTNLNAYLVLDCSGSMAMADSAGLAKLHYARFLAAGLAYLMLGQGDAVSLLCADPEDMEFLPPSSRGTQLMTLLGEMTRRSPRGATVLAPALRLLADRIKSRSLIMVLSDFLVDLDELRSILAFFRYRNHEVILFHVLNDLEREFPFTNVTTFRDLETGRLVYTEPASIRREYLRLLGEHVSRLQSVCRDFEIDFVPLTTTEPLGPALLAYLARRQAAP